jgi:hypothetical protein
MRAQVRTRVRTRSRRRAVVELLRAFALLYLIGSGMLYGSRALRPAGAARAAAPPPQLTAAK